MYINKFILGMVLVGCMFVFGYWCGETNGKQFMIEHAELVHVFDGGYEMRFGTDRVEEYEGEYVID